MNTLPIRLFIPIALLMALPAQAARTNELVASFKIAADLARRSSQELAVKQAASIITTVIASTPDADGDPFPEPPPYLSGAGPTGGGLIPTGLGAPISDGYGAKLGYCAWDNGSVMSGGNRLNGSASDPGAVTFAVVSAGLDRVFNRTCAQIASGAVTSDDDFVVSVSSAQIRQGVGGTVYFGDPVADMTALGLLNSASQKVGEMRLVKSDNTLWRWDGSVWQPVANTYAASNVAVTGGTINNTVIGNTTPSAGAFTTLSGTLTGNVTGNLTGNVTGNLTGNVTGNLTGNVIGNLTGNVNGNADTASRLITARTFSISGDATWSVVFDGSADASGILTLANSGVVAGAYGSAVSVPTFSVDAKGRLTAAANVPVTPALSSLTGAAAANTIGNGTYAQSWNWSLTGNTSALSIGETAASSGGSGNQILVGVATLAGSTAIPLRVASRGVEAFRVDSANPQLVANNGTAAAPSYAFDGEQSTGLYLPLAGQLAASVAGTRSLWVSIDNTALGMDSLTSNTSGTDNVATGVNTLKNNTTGKLNVATGRSALESNTTGSYNSAFGNSALKNNSTGFENVAAGTNALSQNTTGVWNTALGANALKSNTGGNYNLAAGGSALESNTTGSDNSAFGNAALQNNSTGRQNVAVGSNALLNNTTGQYNVAIGRKAGYATSGGSTTNANTIGTNNTFIGAFAMPGVATLIDHATALGADVLVSTSNTVVLGRTADTTVIGATADDLSGNKLQVTGGIKLLSGGLNLATGTTTVAPLTWTSGTSLATPVLGAMEFNGTSLFITAGGPTRKTIAYIDSAMTGDGALITNLNADNIASGTLAVARGGTGLGTTPANGQLLIGNGSGYTLASLTGTANQIIVTPGSGSIGLSLPQDIATTSAPSFAGLTLSGTLMGTSGTVGAPGYTFSADTSTGLYRPAAGQLAASVAGIRSLWISNGSMAIGVSALASDSAITNNNTAVGNYSLTSNTTGIYNVALGFNALKNNTTGQYNTATGNSALELNSTGSRNSAFGNSVLKNNTIGINNVGVGSDALSQNTTGNLNTAVGTSSLKNNLTGDFNVATGNSTLETNTTGSRNSAFGNAALKNNSTGNDNVSVGSDALTQNTTGSYNTAVGGSSLKNNLTGQFNVATGTSALESNTTGSRNAAFGISALKTNSTGSDNVGVGSDALSQNTIGNYNIGVGSYSLKNNVTGGFNVATGTSALESNTTGSSNAAFGNSALKNNSTGSNNLASGYQAGYSISNSISGSNSTFIGSNASVADTANMASSGRITLLGADASASGLGATTANAYMTAIGSGAQVTTANTIVLGRSAAQDSVVIGQSGNGSTLLYVNGSAGGTSGWQNLSDRRFKMNITPVINAINTIKSLEGVHYDFNRAAFPDKNFETGRQIGFIAQQIEPFVPEVVRTDALGYKGIQYAQLVPLLAEGIKEQQLVLQHLIKKDPATLLIDIKTFQANDAVFENIRSTSIKTANLDADTARIKKLEAERIDAKYLRSDVMKSGETEVFVSLGTFQPIFIPLADAQYIVNVTAEDGSSAFASVAFMAGKITVTPISGKGVDVMAMGSQVGLVAASKKVKATWIRMS